MFVGEISKEALEDFRNLAIQLIQEGRLKRSDSNKNKRK